MREEPQARGEDALTLVVDEMMHPDVVLSDIAAAISSRLRNREIHLRGNSFRESLRESGFSPLAPRPVVAISQSLLKCRQGKVKQHDEGELVLKGIVNRVCRRIVAGE